MHCCTILGNEDFWLLRTINSYIVHKYTLNTAVSTYRWQLSATTNQQKARKYVYAKWQIRIVGDQTSKANGTLNNLDFSCSGSNEAVAGD